LSSNEQRGIGAAQDLREQVGREVPSNTSSATVQAATSLLWVTRQI
jgi:hypothetical protein